METTSNILNLPITSNSCGNKKIDNVRDPYFGMKLSVNDELGLILKMRRRCMKIYQAPHPPPVLGKCGQHCSGAEMLLQYQQFIVPYYLASRIAMLVLLYACYSTHCLHMRKGAHQDNSIQPCARNMYCIQHGRPRDDSWPSFNLRPHTHSCNTIKNVLSERKKLFILSSLVQT